MESLRPNLFLVGAPKSGTTALYTYLRHHPHVFMPARKEFHFFSGDICGDQRVTQMSEYLRSFEEAQGKAIIGEASTSYLASKQAARGIRDFNPVARIVVMLRNPIDVMYAEHHERVFGGEEHIQDFEVALDSEDLRVWQWGRFKGHTVQRPTYREIANFSAGVERYFNVFGRENVHVIIYDDFASKPESTYNKLLNFLGVCSNPCEFQVVNANRRLRSRWIQHWLRDIPPGIRLVARALLPADVRHAVGSGLLRLNTKIQPRPKLNQQFRMRLTREYECEILKLSCLIGRDLSSWLSADL